VDYALHILILILLYGTAALSLNVVAGYTGMLSVAHAAFFGIGAYTVALLQVEAGAPFGVALLCAAALAGVIGIAIGLSSPRVRGDHLVLMTFGFQVVVTGVMANWTEVTNGPLGLCSIHKPVILGIAFDSNGRFLLLASGLAIVAFTLCRSIVTAPFGRILMAIREDEVFAQSLGKYTSYAKVAVFTLGGVIAAMAGALYAPYVTFIDPGSFSIQESVPMLAIVIVGGAGNLCGTLLGAVALIAAPELLRFVGLPSAAAASVRQMLYGCLLVLLMLFRPRGFPGKFDFRNLG
jgi:branched-chain amino acid transport system permease protein